MLPSFKITGKQHEPPPTTTPKSGLKRMTGTAHLRPNLINVEETPAADVDASFKKPEEDGTKAPQIKWFSHLSLANIFGSKPEAPVVENKPEQPPSRAHLSRTKTSTGPLKISHHDAPTPNRNMALGASRSVTSLKHEHKKITPLRINIDARTPGGTCSKASFKRKIPESLAEGEELEEEEKTPKSSTISSAISNNIEVTPPTQVRRTSSGSMLLRQTPERMRRKDEGDSQPKEPRSLIRTASPARQNIRKSGSASRIENTNISNNLTDTKKLSMMDKTLLATPTPTKKSVLIPPDVTPVCKRKRTSSVTILPPSTPSSTCLTPSLITPGRLRPRRISESTTPIGDKQAIRAAASPMKKKPRTVSINSSSSSIDPMDSQESVFSSPIKKKCFSSVTIRLQDSINLSCGKTASEVTPLRAPKPMKKVRTQSLMRISHPLVLQDEKKETEKNQNDVEKGKGPPLLRKYTSSINSYKSAIDSDFDLRRSSDDVPFISSSKEKEREEEKEEEEEVFLTARSSLNSESDQNTSDEPSSSSHGSITTKEAAEMVPLVKKQVSIDETKLMEEDEDEGFGDSTKTIKRGQGNHLARSVSLKLMPKREEAKVLKNDTEKSSSTPSLPTAPLIRQTSMSSLRFKVSPSTFLKNLEPLKPVASVATVETSEPSTSKIVVVEKQEKTTKKSALKSGQAEMKISPKADDRKVKFHGMQVFYFERLQGYSTVPSDGEVSLDMEDKHHAKRYFPLTSSRRPILDLSLHEDEELSDGEVVAPDSDDEAGHEDNFQTAKTIPKIEPSVRLQILAQSGIQFKKSTSMSAKAIRKIRNDCGCSCPNGVCVPETCFCSLNGIQCQIDWEEGKAFPCNCAQASCTNPNGRIFYDYDSVQEHRKQIIRLYEASKKTGIYGSPVVKKFVDSEDEGETKNEQTSNISRVLKLEESPTKYPVTPIYTRRSRCLSDIRESNSENAPASLTDKIKTMEKLENDVCVEEEDCDEQQSFNETVIEADLTVREVNNVSIDTDSVETDSVESVNTTTELVKILISPVKERTTATTMVV